MFNSLIKKIIKRFSFVSYILILKNLDYGRNKSVILLFIYCFFFFFGEGCINYSVISIKYPLFSCQNFVLSVFKLDLST
jgi:hypothetical protein